MFKWVLIFLISVIGFGNEASAHDDSKNSIIYIIGWIGPPVLDYITSLDPRKIKRIHLYSEGGKLRDAMKIAEFVRKSKIETYVGEQGRCYSACAVIFQAGIKRIGHRTATFMYHYAFNRKGAEKAIVPSEYWTKVMCDELLRYGIEKNLIDQLKPNKEIYLSSKEAIEYNIVTILEE